MTDDQKTWQISTPGNLEENADANAKRRLSILKAQRMLEKTVGGAEDFVPFAWRNPIDLSGQKRVSKVLRSTMASEQTKHES